MKDEEVIKNILYRARAFIENPDKWLHDGTAHRDAEGQECFKATAVAHSIEGAVAMVGFPPSPTLRHLRATIERHSGLCYELVCSWNEDPERTHAEVLKLFDWAIAELPSVENDAFKRWEKLNACD